MPFKTFASFISLIVYAWAATVPSVAAQDESNARMVVEGFHGELMAVMQSAADTSVSDRNSQLAPVIGSTFDTAYMAQVASGRHWKDFSSEQQSDLIAVFQAFTTANYANRFDGFNGEVFETIGERESRGRKVLQTQIVKSDGEAVPLTYLVHTRQGRPQIADVFLDGAISELATRRSEFQSVLKSGGWQALVDSLKSKTDGLLEG